jgi:hypothetical protein
MGYAAPLEWYASLSLQYTFPLTLSLGFPETIDKLDPEIGQIGGPQPIIFGMLNHIL